MKALLELIGSIAVVLKIAYGVVCDDYDDAGDD